MIKAKVLALCVCPAISAPPAILAVSPPARHAVAHVLHRAARRLDHATAPAAPLLAVAAVTTSAPCPPAIALSSAAIPLLGPDLSINRGHPGQAEAFVDPSLGRSIDRVPSWSALAARYDATSGGNQTTTVQIAAIDLSPAVAANQTSL